MPRDAWDASKRLADRLSSLHSIDGDAAGLLCAWQQMALYPNAWPHFAEPAPTLAELEKPAALVDAWMVLAQVWPHLGDHDPEALVGRVTKADFASACQLLDNLPPPTDYQPDYGGEVRQQMRSAKVAQRTGAFYTPGNLALMMARMVVAGGFEARRDGWIGQRVYDPACGTARLLTAMVGVAAADGLDPQVAGWFGIDLDGPALAIAALNMVGAGAGPHVWLHRGDALTEYFCGPDGTPMRYGIVVANPPFSGPKRDVKSLETQTPVVINAAERHANWFVYDEPPEKGNHP